VFPAREDLVFAQALDEGFAALRNLLRISSKSLGVQSGLDAGIREIQPRREFQVEAQQLQGGPDQLAGTSHGSRPLSGQDTRSWKRR
jgi:hypothetical protein